jgi:tRNA 2-thiouridine synthesizing protein E
MAKAMADELGIGPLTERHWKVISFCREDTARSGHAPNLGRIAKLSGVGRNELFELFPTGPSKLAARISGLPKPQACI